MKGLKIWREMHELGYEICKETGTYKQRKHTAYVVKKGNSIAAYINLKAKREILKIIPGFKTSQQDNVSWLNKFEHMEFSNQLKEPLMFFFGYKEGEMKSCVQ